jgi:hypothetical protein
MAERDEALMQFLSLTGTDDPAVALALLEVRFPDLRVVLRRFSSPASPCSDAIAIGPQASDWDLTDAMNLFMNQSTTSSSSSSRCSL